MPGIEVREEGDGVWVVTIPGADIKRDFPDEFEERCYDLGLMVVGVDGGMLHVSPRDDLQTPIATALKDLRAYITEIAPGAAP